MLADYIVVLIKNNTINDIEAKAYCVEQLMDFLEDNTELFVNGLYDAINSKLTNYMCVYVCERET